MRAGTVVIAMALLAAACANVSNNPNVVDGEVVVFAAASLTDAFAEVEATYEEAHPQEDVVLNLAGSSSLREQILAGAPADVFAAANTSNMDQVVQAGAVSGGPQIFTRNLLQIVVPVGNPAHVTGLADLGDDTLFIGLCAEGVPCGDFARQALRNAGVTPTLDTNEPDVRSLLTKVEAGELDAGIVYVTDVIAAGDKAEGIDIPEEQNVQASYPIVALADGPNPAGAEAFVAFVLSTEGQAILNSYGFSSP
jgi:molybdate transport system substrate-binding protein